LWITCQNLLRGDFFMALSTSRLNPAFLARSKEI
jgi:hypothetical protein